MSSYLVSLINRNDTAKSPPPPYRTALLDDVTYTCRNRRGKLHVPDPEVMK